jgi:hypothetical protein
MIITKACAVELGNALLDAAENDDKNQVLLKTDEGSVFVCEYKDDNHDEGYETIAVVLAS